ncbi:MAG: hypothetical protein H0U52_16230 [Chloroflexi bacterium]|nr:hypothetical protein [Chloroflexota bacterium]
MKIMPYLCGVPSVTLGPCDLDWGHAGDMHSSACDGFFAWQHVAEHRRRQAVAAQLLVSP